MSWLRDNAAVVQAFAAIAALIVTGILAQLTANYVRLTRDIASASLEQVKHLKEAPLLARQQSARSLLSLSRRIRVPLGELDAAAPTFHKVRNYDLLTEPDIADLESLARQVDEKTVTYAGKAAVSLRRIEGLIRKAKSIHESTGWIPTAEEATVWKTAMDAGPTMLAELEKSCQEVIATQPTAR